MSTHFGYNGQPAVRQHATVPEFHLDHMLAFNIEVYPSRWMVGLYRPRPDGPPYLEPITNDDGVDELAPALDAAAAGDMTLVGYGSTDYDVLILRAILAGRTDIHELSQAIITANEEAQRDEDADGPAPSTPTRAPTTHLRHHAGPAPAADTADEHQRLFLFG